MRADAVLILGAGGYIGSALVRFLRGGQNFAVTGVDNGLRPGPAPDLRRDYRDLTADDLAAFDSGVLMAGHSSVAACDRDPEAAFGNNVAGFVDLVHKLRGQKLIFASSASVYVRTNGRAAAEDEPLPEPVSYYDMHKRAIEQYAAVAYPNGYALRFGTVCGPSANTRTDVLLNALVRSALTAGHVRVANRTTRRPLLGITDLCRAVAALLTSNAPPGAYNLSSVNVTVGETADYVAERFGVPCVPVESPTRYDMATATDKLTRATGVAPTETVAQLVEQLAAHYAQVAIPA
jgi:nucleoside-diphosphate-sugar epimerase